MPIVPLRATYAARYDVRNHSHKRQGVGDKPRRLTAADVSRSSLAAELAKKSFGLSWPRNPSLSLRSAVARSGVVRIAEKGCPVKPRMLLFSLVTSISNVDIHVVQHLLTYDLRSLKHEYLAPQSGLNDLRIALLAHILNSSKAIATLFVKSNIHGCQTFTHASTLLPKSSILTSSTSYHTGS